MFKYFIVKNKILILLLVICILIIVSYGITDNWPVIIDVDHELVNFYYGKLIDLCDGYIVSLVFYIIVVYCPEYKRRENIRCKTHTIFARMQTYLRKYIEMCLRGFQIEVLEDDNVQEKWGEHFNEVYIDIYSVLNREFDDNLTEMSNSRYGDTYIEVLNSCAKNIIKYKSELIPFVMFLDEAETELYIELEELFIFEQITKGFNEIGAEALFIDEFTKIVECFYQTNDVVGVKRQRITCELNEYDEYIRD